MAAASALAATTVTIDQVLLMQTTLSVLRVLRGGEIILTAMNRLTPALLLVAILVSTTPAQERGRGGRLSVGVAPVPLPAGPVVFDTAEQHKIRVVIVTKELSHPWGMAWMPDGDLLVTERPGRLRILRNGVLNPASVSGLPPMH